MKSCVRPHHCGNDSEELRKFVSEQARLWGPVAREHNIQGQHDQQALSACNDDQTARSSRGQDPDEPHRRHPKRNDKIALTSTTNQFALNVPRDFRSQKIDSRHATEQGSID
jgi:hypothetical protein